MNGRRSLSLLALALALGGPGAAAAATIEVDSTADDLPDGENGSCSLREAVLAANTDAPVDGCAAGDGADRIELPAGTFVLAIPGRDEDAAATGDLDLLDDLTLVGAGTDQTVVDAARLDRVLHVHPGVALVVEQIGVTGGELVFDGVPRGGGILAEDAELTVRHARIFENARSVSTHGGGVHASGSTLRIEHSTIERNNVPELIDRGGGVALWSSEATVSDSLFLGNVSTQGGGLYVGAGSSAEVIRSTFLSNSASLSWGASGGGIANHGELRVESSGLHLNWASASGISLPAIGSAIQNWGSAALVHVTVSGPGPPGAYLLGSSDGTMTLDHVAVVSDPPGWSSGAGCYFGAVTSLGHNLDDDGSCALDQPTDRSNRSAAVELVPASPSAATLVAVPRPESPLVDGGAPGPCASAEGIRSVPRPQDADGDGEARCDIGSTELRPEEGPVRIFSDDFDQGSPLGWSLVWTER